MRGKMALVGGEEFRIGCEDMDREVMRASGSDPAKVIIVPTAAVTGPAEAANDGVTHFVALGGVASQLMVLDGTHADDPELVKPVESADVVYFTGGSPEHLLTSLRDSELLRLLLSEMERGMVLGGSSAGAMAMGSMMRLPNAGNWREGLGVVPGVAVMPHHERSDPAATARQLQESAPSGIIFLGIDARTGCLGTTGDWRVVGLGKVTVYQAGEFGVYNSGERLPGGF